MNVIRNLIHNVQALIFLPALLINNLQSLYVFTLLSMVTASYIYWPDERWLIFPLCLFIACSFFKIFTDLRSWVKLINDGIMFIGKVARDKQVNKIDMHHTGTITR